MEYQVLNRAVITDLEKEVTERIEEGWEPLGGVAMSVTEDWEFFAQTMIRRDDA